MKVTGYFLLSYYKASCVTAFLCVCVFLLINIQHAPLQGNITCFRVKQLHLYYFWIISLLHY